MAFKVAFIAVAPDGDPGKHRAIIKTPKLELTVVVIKSRNSEQAVKVCQDLVQEEGVQNFILCPGFVHQTVAKIANAVGEKVAINVARGDHPSERIIDEIAKKEGWR
jgi:hypothetical protein